MKSLVFFAAAALILFAAGTSWAQAPNIEAGVRIKDGSNPLSVDRHSAPSVVDWNNDGKKDLVIGQFTYGYVWLYLNQGTNAEPVFNGATQIKSNGVAITTSYG
jgi:hypothetical protein